MREAHPGAQVPRLPPASTAPAPAPPAAALRATATLQRANSRASHLEKQLENWRAVRVPCSMDMYRRRGSLYLLEPGLHLG
jgi:hypothetical protein